ncbi:hypothetical protein [Nocardia crassostreae]|uniref:hypothetical protein n=1 Tax=Nocardia crassostreae TaxID=53428 RepID=UPI000831B619|nr:hypothetical protein [Nocardia crassostreae]
MVSSQHEAMHRLFRRHPEVFGHAFAELNLPFPEPRSVALLPNDLTEIEPLERRVDTLLRIDTGEGPFLLLVEAQGRDDKKKFSAWAYYLAHVHAKYDLHPVLLVICQDTTTAAWAAGPHRIGPPQWTSLTVRPLVLGPHNVQRVTDLRTAVEDVPLATLSAITHANDPGIGDILKTLATALQTIDEDDALIFAELTELGLGKSQAGNYWRQLMTVDLSFFRSETSQRLRAKARSEGLAEGLAEGRSEGLAQAVLHMLDRAGVAVSDDARSRINSCADPEQLLSWLDKAVSARTVDDLYRDEEG